MYLTGLIGQTEYAKALEYLILNEIIQSPTLAIPPKVKITKFQPSTERVYPGDSFYYDLWIENYGTIDENEGIVVSILFPEGTIDMKLDEYDNYKVKGVIWDDKEIRETKLPENSLDCSSYQYTTSQKFMGSDGIICTAYIKSKQIIQYKFPLNVNVDVTPGTKLKATAF